MNGSPIYEAAAAQARAARLAYFGYLETHISDATDATRGQLVNARGEARGVEPRALFMGPGVTARARAYADDPLREFWAETPRLTLPAFERLWLPTQSPEYTANVYLSRAEFAARIGVRPDSMGRYVLPEPDAYIGDVRGWSAATVDAWHAGRPRKSPRG